MTTSLPDVSAIKTELTNPRNSHSQKDSLLYRITEALTANLIPCSEDVVALYLDLPNLNPKFARHTYAAIPTLVDAKPDSAHDFARLVNEHPYNAPNQNGDEVKALKALYQNDQGAAHILVDTLYKNLEDLPKLDCHTQKQYFERVADCVTAQPDITSRVACVTLDAVLRCDRTLGWQAGLETIRTIAAANERSCGVILSKDIIKAIHKNKSEVARSRACTLAPLVAIPFTQHDIADALIFALREKKAPVSTVCSAMAALAHDFPKTKNKLWDALNEVATSPTTLWGKLTAKYNSSCRSDAANARDKIRQPSITLMAQQFSALSASATREKPQDKLRHTLVL